MADKTECKPLDETRLTAARTMVKELRANVQGIEELRHTVMDLECRMATTTTALLDGVVALAFLFGMKGAEPKFPMQQRDMYPMYRKACQYLSDREI